MTIQIPTKFDLDVPYVSQWQVKANPTGSCNVSSIAMCLMATGIVGDGSCETLAEQLYYEMQSRRLDRHYPEDLAQIVRFHHRSDHFMTTATLDDIKKWIYYKRLPVVIHTYLTSFGHIIVLKGFDEKGFIVHDPYGEWYSSAYDTGVGEGKNEHYSYDLISRTASPEGAGNCWCHFICQGSPYSL